MSIVLSVCGTNFSIMMSDGRMIKLDDNSVVYENFPKIQRINTNVIIGYTGDPIASMNMIEKIKYYDPKTLTLEGVKDVAIKSLKSLNINELGVKLIFSGRSMSNRFVTYTIDSKENFKETPYVFDNGFAINFALPHDNNGEVLKIINKHIYNTVPWKSLEEIRIHMKECIEEISTICHSVNDNIFEEFII